MEMDSNPYNLSQNPLFSLSSAKVLIGDTLVLYPRADGDLTPSDSMHFFISTALSIVLSKMSYLF